jgi:hypothetical protein
MAAWLGGPHASVWALGLSNTGFTCAIWCDRGVVAHNLRLEGHHAHISVVRRILRGREDEGENEIPTCLLDYVAHLSRIPLQFELVTVHIDIQIQVFILIAFTINEETALGVPFAEFYLKHLYGLPQRDRLKVTGAGHANSPPR